MSTFLERVRGWCYTCPMPLKERVIGNPKGCFIVQYQDGCVGSSCCMWNISLTSCGGTRLVTGMCKFNSRDDLVTAVQED